MKILRDEFLHFLSADDTIKEQTIIDAQNILPNTIGYRFGTIFGAYAKFRIHRNGADIEFNQNARDRNSKVSDARLEHIERSLGTLWKKINTTLCG